MIKVLLLTISFFLLIFLESFFLKVFSFSLFVVVSISFYKKIDHIVYFVLITLFTTILDTVLHTPLGVHMISTAIALVLLESLWFLIPRDGTFGFVPVFVGVFVYYISLLVFTSLLRDSVLPTLSLEFVLQSFLKGIFSIPIYIGIAKTLAFLRKDDIGSKIRLR